MDTNKIIQNKKTKFLIVGGTFDKDGGRPSGLIEKIITEFKIAEVNDNIEVLSFNGGNYDDLTKIQTNLLPYFDVVLWWANVPNDLPKVRDVKEINYKVISVTSKRNDNNKYTFQEILQRMLQQKANLNVTFEKQEDGNFKFSLIDPLGNMFYSGNRPRPLVETIIKRAIFLKEITRLGTINDTEHQGQFNWYYKMFNEDIVNDCSYSEEKVNQLEEIENKKKFLSLVKDYAEVFTKTIFNVKEQAEIKRFLGNASFRCQKGFPSYREGEYIFVSRRNVDKTHISINEFVPTYLKDNKVYYLGENKPSVDTPVQLYLYNELPNIKYMLHAHVYIDGAPMTERTLPCGALEEAGEILDYIQKHIKDGLETKFLAINLKGHGCLIMSDDVDKIESLKEKIIARPKPELIEL